MAKNKCNLLCLNILQALISPRNRMKRIIPFRLSNINIIELIAESGSAILYFITIVRNIILNSNRISKLKKGIFDYQNGFQFKRRIIKRKTNKNSTKSLSLSSISILLLFKYLVLLIDIIDSSNRFNRAVALPSKYIFFTQGNKLEQRG